MLEVLLPWIAVAIWASESDNFRCASMSALSNSLCLPSASSLFLLLVESFSSVLASMEDLADSSSSSRPCISPIFFSIVVAGLATRNNHLIVGHLQKEKLYLDNWITKSKFKARRIIYLEEGQNGPHLVLGGPLTDNPLGVDGVDDALKKALGNLLAVKGAILGLVGWSTNFKKINIIAGDYAVVPYDIANCIILSSKTDNGNRKKIMAILTGYGIWVSSVHVC